MLGCQIALACGGASQEGEPLPLVEGQCAPQSVSEVQLPAGETVGVCTSRVAGASAIVAEEQYPVGLIYDGHPHEALPDRVAYLTFDDGPSEWTLEFLQILLEKQVKATFFINAKHLKGSAGLEGEYRDGNKDSVAFRDVLARVVQDGHAIGNHTVGHTDLAGLNEQAAAKELDENERLINTALVQAMQPTRVLSLVRPPFGSPWFRGKVVPQDVVVARKTTGNIVRNRGVNVLWNIDSSDSREWAADESYTKAGGRVTADPSVSFASKVQRLQTTILGDALVTNHKGVVILMHDTHNATRDALPAIIDGLRAAGYSFATVEEFVESRWRRSSLQMTPGPGLYNACMPDDDRGCMRVGGPTKERICGRVLQAYQAAGGEPLLGAAVGALQTATGSAAFTQEFEHGILALHPELAPPCNVAVISK